MRLWWASFGRGVICQCPSRVYRILPGVKAICFVGVQEAPPKGAPMNVNEGLHSGWAIMVIVLPVLRLGHHGDCFASVKVGPSW